MLVYLHIYAFSIVLRIQHPVGCAFNSRLLAWIFALNIPKLSMVFNDLYFVSNTCSAFSYFRLISVVLAQVELNIGKELISTESRLYWDGNS